MVARFIPLVSIWVFLTAVLIGCGNSGPLVTAPLKILAAPGNIIQAPRAIVRIGQGIVRGCFRDNLDLTVDLYKLPAGTQCRTNQSLLSTKQLTSNISILQARYILRKSSEDARVWLPTERGGSLSADSRAASAHYRDDWIELTLPEIDCMLPSKERSKLVPIVKLNTKCGNGHGKGSIEEPWINYSTSCEYYDVSPEDLITRIPGDLFCGR